MDRLFQYLNKNSTYLLLLLIVVIAIGTRFFWLDKSPPSLNWDEVAHGYNAYSLLKTGKDEFGTRFPLFLRSFDEYKPAFYSYLSIPFVALFGLKEISVRAISAISGVILVFIIFFLSREIFKKKSVALIAALLVAVEPWSILFSRVAFEANLALALFFGGIYFIVKSKLSGKLGILGFALVSISTYAYNAEKILVIPVFIASLYFYKKTYSKNKKYAIYSLVVGLLILLPLIYLQMTRVETLGRFWSTSIIKVWEIQKSQNPNFFVENQVFFMGKQIASRYLSYFSPVNLFVRGTPEPTQKVPGFGMFYSLESIFWLLGLFWLAKRVKEYKFFIFLLILAPLPAAITWNWFYPLRVTPLFALFSIVIALGLDTLWKSTKKNFAKIHRYFWFGLVVFGIMLFSNLSTSILLYLPYKERGNWQFGMKQVIEEVSKVENNYQKIIFETRTAQPHIFALFYSKYPPEKYHQEIETKGGIEIPRKNFDIGKYEFRDVLFRDDKELKNTLLVGPESSLPLEIVKSFQNTEIVIDVNDFEGNLLGRIVGLK